LIIANTVSIDTMTLQTYGIQHYNTKKFTKRGLLPGKDTILKLSMVANLVLIFFHVLLSLRVNLQKENPTATTDKKIVAKNQMWHGGHPIQDRSGSCWCSGDDEYCMCTPNLAIDLIITSSSSSEGNSNSANMAEYVWLVRRKDTGQLATMGGFVDINETVEHAVKRELHEEMGYVLSSPPKLVGVYSDPRRDNRRRTVSAVFAVHMKDDFQPQAGDDAKEVIRILIDDIELHTYFADHKTILMDYRSQLRGETFRESTKGDFAADIKRSTCVASR
jgi:8-oxo-dGTP diphosphatase